MALMENQAGGENGADSHATARAVDAALGNRNGSNRGGKRPGAGRPSSNPAPKAQGKPVEEAPAATPEDIEFCRETAKGILRIADSLITGRIQKAVAGIDSSFEELSLKMADQVHITEHEIKFVSDTAAALAAKYSALTRYAPEIALVGWVGSYGLRVVGCMKEIKALATQVHAMKVAKPQPASGNEG